MKKKPIIIGFAGPKGSGKTFNAWHAARVANDLDLSTRITSFAAPLKRMLEALGVPAKTLNRHELKEEPLQYPFAGLTPRRLMQTLGTEWGRDMIAKSLWIDLMGASVESFAAQGVEVVIIDDVRFSDEAQYVADNGILICLVGVDYSGAHQSEMPLDVSGLHNVIFASNTDQAIAHVSEVLRHE